MIAAKKFRLPSLARVFLVFEEAEAMIKSAPTAWRALVFTAIRTGLRQGELQELRWRDIKLSGSRAYVRVARSLRRLDGGAHEVKATKGDRPRSVPLSTDLVEALLRHRGEAGDDELVSNPITSDGLWCGRSRDSATIAPTYGRRRPARRWGKSRPMGRQSGRMCDCGRSRCAASST